jgi:hypothetical protein
MLQLEDWYTVNEAARVLTKRSGRTVKGDYVNKLAKLGKIRAHKISERVTLYFKPDVDNYVVEARGAKSGRAKRQQTLEKGKKGQDAS